MKSFMQNADNFICSDVMRNAKVNESANLAHKFGYTSQQFARIKAFAEWQFCEGYAQLPVILPWGDASVSSPWVDDSARFELTDIGAINCYGEEFLRSWCARAHEALHDEKLLDELKQWSENASYKQGFPYRNPIELYGLEW